MNQKEQTIENIKVKTESILNHVKKVDLSIRPEVTEFIESIKFSSEYFLSTIDLIPNQNEISLNLLNTLLASYTNINTNMIQYVTSFGPNYRNQIEANLQTSNIYSSSLEMFLPKRAKELYAQLNKFKIEADAKISNLSVEKDKIIDEFSSLKHDIDNEKKFKENQKKIEVELKNQIEIYSKSIADYFMTKNVEFDKVLAEMKSNLESSYVIKIDGFQKQIKDLYIESSVERDKIKKLVALVNNATVAGSFQKVAKSEKISMNTWRIVSVISFLLIAFSGFLVIYNKEVLEMDFSNIFTRIFLLSSLGSLAAFSVNVSSNHRKQYLFYKQLELEHATLDNYIVEAGLEKENIKRELLPKYYGDFSQFQKENSIKLPKNIIELLINMVVEKQE